MHSDRSSPCVHVRDVRVDPGKSRYRCKVHCNHGNMCRASISCHDHGKGVGLGVSPNSSPVLLRMRINGIVRKKWHRGGRSDRQVHHVDLEPSSLEEKGLFS